MPVLFPEAAHNQTKHHTMQLALTCCYEAVIKGLSTALANLSTLATQTGWGQAQYNDLVQRLGAIRTAELAVFTATHALSDRLKEAENALGVLKTALAAHNPVLPVPTPSPESSMRYSVSLSTSSSLTWQYPSGGVWVTANSSAKIGATCPGAGGGSSFTLISSGPGRFSNLKLKPLKKLKKKAAPKKPGRR